MNRFSGVQYPTVSNVPPAGLHPADLDVSRRLNPRGPPRRPIPSRGGQLEVAGIVVGNWGPNYSLSRPRMPTSQVSFLILISAFPRPPVIELNEYE